MKEPTSNQKNESELALGPEVLGIASLIPMLKRIARKPSNLILFFS